jgi:hypothetical protein
VKALGGLLLIGDMYEDNLGRTNMGRHTFIATVLISAIAGSTRVTVLMLS